MNNKVKFIEALSTELGSTKKSAADLLGLFSALIKESLLTDGAAVLPGVGKLKLHTRPARVGRNPRTGEQIQISEKQVVKFRPSSKLF